MPAAPPDPAKRNGLRARLLRSMVVFVAVALVVAGAVAGIVQYLLISAEVDAQLRGTHAELRALADEGVNPETGEAFDGPTDLLAVFMARTVMGEEEGELAFVGGEIRQVAPSAGGFVPEGDAQLVEELMSLGSEDQTVIRDLRTDSGHYRVLVVPVQFPGDAAAFAHIFDLEARTAELRRSLAIYAAAAVVAWLLVAVASRATVRGLLRPVEELRTAADAIDEHDLTTRVPVRGGKDLTGLSVTMNRMLDRVQHAVEGQRRLLDDVGHELRTPITVVRGHMEVIDADDPHDVRQTRDLVLDETDRMRVLVDDMLMLARATDSDFVRPQWVDTATLTDQVLEKARALGERSWRLEQVTPAEAWLDPARVTQAWLQLAANAVKYSQPGSAVALGSRLHRGEVWLWVRDEGIGISADQLIHVRQRFARTPEAAEHASGVGLGLSIVESIVGAHRGRLDIESEPGKGSLFTMILPLAPLAVPGPIAKGDA